MLPTRDLFFIRAKEPIEWCGYAPIAQLAEAEDLKSFQCRFESDWGYETERSMRMNDIRKAVRSLTQFNPPPAPRYGVATRAALAISVPFAILALLGYPEIGLQAAAGAFTALYAASATVKERAKVLPFVGVGLLVCAGLGVLLATWQWAFAAGLVIIAVLAATLCLAFRVGPPGPVFFVLMYGLSGNIERDRWGA